MMESSVETRPDVARKKYWPKWRFCSASVSTSPYAKNILNTIPLSQGWQVDWFTSLADARKHWEQLPTANNLFLTTDYFQLMDQMKLRGISNGFAIFRHPDHSPFGLVIQIFQFNPEEQMGKLDQGAEVSNGKRFAAKVRNRLARILRFNILSAGQMLLTGDHSTRGQLPKDAEAATELISEGMEAIACQWPERIHAVMLKDMPLADHPGQRKYTPLPVQPNMLFKVINEWASFDDYLNAMSSKYRVRARRARKKGLALERREMLLPELEERQTEMFGLYQGIARQSDFNTVVLPPNYFVAWKRNFPGRFKVWGYYQEEQFVGFSTAVYNDHELEAHFLGFDQSYNRSHQLYLNMLYDLVNEAIVAGSNQLIFSRTALEIKSSVGAVPEDLQCWVRSRVAIARPLVPVVARFIAPLPDWVQRKPFKA